MYMLWRMQDFSMGGVQKLHQKFVCDLYCGEKITRGGVEDKKNPRPRTAFTRTDTLEAKDRNA